MKFQTLENVTIDLLMDAFNAAFSDYILPMQLSQEQLTAKLSAEMFEAKYSVGVFHENKLLGFILHGFKEESGKRILYNSGTGVIPSHRGKGLTQKMYAHFISTADRVLFDEILLEVIESNFPAIVSYEKSGFVKKRFLKCYRGNFKNTKLNNLIKIQRIKTIDWQTAKTFWDTEPSWQNDVQAIGTMADNLFFIQAIDKQNMVGYLVYNPINKRIVQLAVAVEYRRKGIASALLHSLLEEYPAVDFSITNIDDDCVSAISFLEALGFSNFINQWEMVFRTDN